MPLLLTDKQLDCGEIIRVADPLGIARRRRVEVPAIRGFAELPRLQRTDDRGKLLRRGVGAVFPGDGAWLARVGAKVGKPLGGGQWLGTVARRGAVRIGSGADGFACKGLCETKSTVMISPTRGPKERDREARRFAPQPRRIWEGSEVANETESTLQYKVNGGMQARFVGRRECLEVANKKA